MRSTFFYKEHPRHFGEAGCIKADYVAFENGWVVFYEAEEREPSSLELTQQRRIIKAVHKEACHDLREVLNEPEPS